MVESEIQIANMALRSIGVRRVLGAFTDSNPETEACNLFYSQNRDAALEEFDWFFARRRSVLAARTETRTGWAYTYGLPDDFVATRYLINSGARTPTESQRIPFDLELADDGETLMLLSDQTAPELVYTARIETPELFSPLFVEALVWRLAAALVIPLSVKPDMVEECEKRYAIALNKAIAAKQGQRTEDPLPASEFVSSRA